MKRGIEINKIKREKRAKKKKEKIVFVPNPALASRGLLPLLSSHSSHLSQISPPVPASRRHRPPNPTPASLDRARPGPAPRGVAVAPAAAMRSSIATYRESLSRLAGEVDDAAADEVPALTLAPAARGGDLPATPPSSGRRRRYSRPGPGPEAAQPDEVNPHPRGKFLRWIGLSRGSCVSGMLSGSEALPLGVQLQGLLDSMISISQPARVPNVLGKIRIDEQAVVVGRKRSIWLLISGFKCGVDSEVGKGSVYVNIAFASVIDPVINVASS